MSTWKPVWGGVEDYEGVPLRLVSFSEWGVVPRLAFDALLAVAKAAHHNETYSSDGSNSTDLNQELSRLDSAFPNWRNWE